MPDSATPQFNIQIGNELTWNVQPILHEIRHALAALLETGETRVIDLRSIPLAPGEEQTIIDTLCCGEVHAKLNALGPSEIYETRFAGVWLITHYNEENSVIGRFIEITKIPDILQSQNEDMAIALQQLETELSERGESDKTETQAETNT
jgi:hydrogenase-1 operon protein HyaF